MNRLASYVPVVYLIPLFFLSVNFAFLLTALLDTFFHLA